MKCAGLKPDQIPEEIFRVAESFSAAVNLMVHGTTEGAALVSTVNAKEVLALPTIVSEAFSAELYLKCLSTIDGTIPPPRGHDLHKLFSSLNRDTKLAVEKRYQSLRSINLATERKAKVSGEDPATGIEEVLQESSLAFAELRYAWEADYRWRNFDLMNVRFALRQTILQLRPQLKGILKTMSVTAHVIKPCGPDCRGVLGHRVR